MKTLTRKQKRIIQEKAYGTHARNEQMRLLAKNGSSYADVGRWFKLSRQAVRMIVNPKDENG